MTIFNCIAPLKLKSQKLGCYIHQIQDSVCLNTLEKERQR